MSRVGRRLRAASPLGSIFIACLGWAIAGASLAAPDAAGYLFPRYQRPAEIARACEALLADTRRLRARITDAAQVPDAGLLDAFDALQRRDDDTLGPLALLAAVHPDKPMRDAAETCTLRHQPLADAFLQNARVHARLQALTPVDPIDTHYRQDLLDAMEDAGVALPRRQRERARALASRIAALTQDFERRLRDDPTRLAFTAEQLAGVPRAIWATAPRDANGRHLLRADAPTYLAVIENAQRADTRERFWRAMQNLGGQPNLDTLAELARLRRERASLFGQASYADSVLRRRMAGSEAGVQQFLDEVRQAVSQRERSDLQALREAKAAQLGRPVDRVRLDRWDVAYYLERVRSAQYAVNTEQFRKHFPSAAGPDLLFRLAERLFGVRFVPDDQPLWHREAKAFGVYDAAGGAQLGELFIDLYPRPGKYNHAAVWGFRSGATSVGRTGAAALVANLSRDGLTLYELETLLHEFGHALHGMLSATRYASQNGLNTPLDFVEAPSQMLEEWVYDPAVVAWMQSGCKDCEPVPRELLMQAERARHFGKGLEFARQHLYASYDLALYGRQAVDPMGLWARMEAATPLGHVKGTRYPAGFEHVAGGYAAGYYGYLWSLALAEDLRTAFAADKLDATVGRRYRDVVLAPGAQRPPVESMVQLLGRPASREAFFRWLDKR